MRPDGQKREDVAKAREQWRQKQAQASAGNTYWLDETGVNCGMTRLYGRAPKNERIFEQVPYARFERVSLMGALGPEGIIAPVVYDGALNGEFFASYVREALAPVMKAGDTLELDNLSCHKVKGALEPLLEKGVKVVFLPAYSPDLNPIEHAWSKIKAYLRKVKARTPDELFSALGTAVDLITPCDAVAWIKHCGYRL